MPGFLVRALIAAAGLWLASVLVPGLAIRDGATLALAALLLGVVNALVRPLVVLVTLPLTVLTLGLFLWVVNAAMLGLVAALLDGFHIAGFFSALFGWLIVTLTNWLASGYVGPSGRIETIVIERPRA
jgi:putative membrane protein